MNRGLDSVKQVRVCEIGRGNHVPEKEDRTWEMAESDRSFRD